MCPFSSTACLLSIQQHSRPVVPVDVEVRLERASRSSRAVRTASSLRRRHYSLHHLHVLGLLARSAGVGSAFP